MAIFFTPQILTGLSSTTKRVLYFGAILFALFTVGSFLLGSIALSVLGTIFGGPVLVGLIVISSPLLLVFGVAAVNVALISLGTFFGVKFLLKRCRRASRGSLEESDEEIIIASEIPSPDGGKCQEANKATEEKEPAQFVQQETDEAVQQDIDETVEENIAEVKEEAAEDTKGGESVDEKPEEKVNDEDSGSAEDETMPMVSPEPNEPAAWASPEGAANALSPESQQSELFTSSGEQQFTSAESMEELNSEADKEGLTSGAPEVREDKGNKAENRSPSSSQQSTDTEAGKTNGSHNAKSTQGSKVSRSATPPEAGSHSLKHPDTPVPGGKHAKKKNRKKNKQKHQQAHQRKDHQNA